MTEYTTHVQVPDAAIGAVLYDAVLGFTDVTCCTLRSGNGTWLSFGFSADSDDDASMLASTIRFQSSHGTDVAVPLGYEAESLKAFESAPMIIVCGRTVIHSEGI